MILRLEYTIPGSENKHYKLIEIAVGEEFKFIDINMQDVQLKSVYLGNGILPDLIARDYVITPEDIEEVRALIASHPEWSES